MAMGYCSVVAAASNALLTLMKTLFANDGKYPTHQLLQTLQLEKKKPKLVTRAGLSSWDPHVIDTGPTGGLGLVAMIKGCDS